MRPGTPVTRRGRAEDGVVVAVPCEDSTLSTLGLFSVTWAISGVTELCGPDDVAVLARSLSLVAGDDSR